MVGTLFLFLYWPSFNAALASIPIGENIGVPTEALASSQFLSIVNTLLSLLGSTVATFAISAFTGQGRLNMMHIQNSSLAGGVAMASYHPVEPEPMEYFESLGLNIFYEAPEYCGSTTNKSTI